MEGEGTCGECLELVPGLAIPWAGRCEAGFKLQSPINIPDLLMFGLKLAYFAIIAVPLTSVLLVFIVPMLSGSVQEHKERLDRATQFHRQGRLPEAVYEYGQAIATKPDFAEAYAFRGEAWLALGVQTQALRDFDQALGYQHQIVTIAIAEDLRIFKIAMAQSHHGRAVVYANQGYELKYQKEAARARDWGYIPGLMETAFMELQAGQ